MSFIGGSTVFPDPFTAVRLSDTGVAGSQYINANYIRVSTQHPTCSSSCWNGRIFCFFQSNAATYRIFVRDSK